MVEQLYRYRISCDRCDNSVVIETTIKEYHLPDGWGEDYVEHLELYEHRCDKCRKV